MGYTFDGDNKRINLSAGTTQMSVRDVWSRWVDWLLTSDNSKYPMAFSNLGGDEIDPGAGTKVPIYAFLLNGWRIKPQEANHTLTVTDGVLLVLGGGDPFVNTIGAYVVRINYQQPVQAISFSSEGGSGGLTQPEHDQLMAIPTETLTQAEGQNLVDIKTKTDQLTFTTPYKVDAVAELAGALTQEEHDQVMKIGGIETEVGKIDLIMADTDEIPALQINVGEISAIVTLLKAFVVNRKYLEKQGTVWSLIIRDAGDGADILRKVLKDKSGNNISDIEAGVLAEEIKSSV